MRRGAMRRRAAVVAGWLLAGLIAGGGALAGQRDTRSDPVSGSWGMDGLPYLELKFDGTRGVSGTAIWRNGSSEERSPIATGTFDRETGALHLTGDARNERGEVVRYVIDGKVEKDVVSGTYRVGEQAGDFRFVKL